MRKAKRFCLEYEDDFKIVITRDFIESGDIKGYELYSLLTNSFAGSLPVLRDILGIPKGFPLTEAILTLQGGAREALDENIELFKKGKL